MTTGARIRKYREAMGITQVQLAHCVGVAPNSVARWERDESQPPLAGVLLFALHTAAERWEELPGASSEAKLAALFRV